MDDMSFRNMFCERFAIYMGDFLNERGIHAVWDPMYDMIYTEYAIHRWYLRWYYIFNYDQSIIDTWLSQRTDYVYRYLQEFYNLEPLIPFVIEKFREGDEPAKILFNGIKLSEGIFDGKYYQGRSVTLQGSTQDDAGIAGWEVTVESPSGDKSTDIIPGDTYVFTMPDCAKVTVCPIIDDITSVLSVNATNSQLSRGWYTIDGRRLDSKPTRKGIYIHDGKKVSL
jgi:hypothetical protein